MVSAVETLNMFAETKYQLFQPEDQYRTNSSIIITASINSGDSQ